MYIVRKSMEFSAAHALRDYEGPCARVHGHNYRVEVEVQGPDLDERELLVDFYDVDRALVPLIATVDHQLLNEIPPFTEVNPTAEAIAAWFYRELKSALGSLPPGGRLAAVHIWETPDSCASYREE
jgi:6-pyruvoyltetrahydropterin/6-carboxytetrahydropterin synthase